ncbi:MAG: hypothetical protein J6S63_11460 [Atopobiaceae bacterium]|nr:hypothetical protein [Atopobiaceae bacterium]
MKPIRFVELLSNIKANIIAFVSIAMFVSLGIGLYVGIQWSSDALRSNVQNEIDTGRLNDICIQFPYGLTTSDVEELKKVEGVTDLETGYSCFASMIDGNNSHTLKIQTITDSIDVFTSVKGNVPMEPNEVAVLGTWANAHGFAIGDTVRLRHDASSSDDTDGMEYLTADTYTITALVTSPAYLFKQSTSYGVSNIASGSIDCVAFVTEPAFDTDKFQDGYPVVYVRCSGLDGLQTFSDEYKQGVEPIANSITDLGRKLGTARYNDVHGKAQDEYDDAERQLQEGEEQLAAGKQELEEREQQLADGKQQIEAGEKELVDGRQQLASQQVVNTQKLADAYRQLAEGQAKYDAGMEQYNTAAGLFNEVNAKFNSVRDAYEHLLQTVEELRGVLATYETEVGAAERAYQEYKNEVARIDDEVKNANGEETDEQRQQWESRKEAAWNKVSTAYGQVLGPLSQVKSVLGKTGQPLGSLGGVMGVPLSLDDRSSFELPGTLTPDAAERELARARELIDGVRSDIDRLMSVSLTVNGITITLTDVPGGLQLVSDQLAESKAQLDTAKAQLDAGWSEYNAGRSEYDRVVAESQAKIDEGQRRLDDSKATAEDGEQKLEEGRATLDEKTKELDEGKAKLEDGKAQLDKLKKYEWVVLSRLENGGIQSVNVVSNMMLQMRWAMASLFIIVGLFVCYSAISRLVHEQGVQIGTKKALGFHEGEIASQYLLFSGLAVVLGALISFALAIILIEGIVNPKAYNQFDMVPYGPYFSLVDLLALGGLELALILGATWFAIHGMLKRNAIDLLKGESTANAKAHFYENTKLWQRMSLYSQTIVNNCVNDKRRVVGTLVGVIGCTALIVTAVTLSSNVSRSLERHYTDVYSFDSVVYLTDQSEASAASVGMALYNRGVTSTPVYKRSMQVRKSDGLRAVATLVVPTNEESFDKLYRVTSTDGSAAQVENGGLWVSAAYGEHMGVKPGDEIILTDDTGKTHTFVIAGFFNYYLMRHEFVLSQREYRQAFGETPQTNAILIDSDGQDLNRLREHLNDVEGYGSLVNDREVASYAFGEIEDVLRTVVYIYLALSALMALMVLLNLDMMFVSEKKRELIVLMINGFSAREAQAYIYRDSIALTVIGIAFGIVVGAIMGGITVYSLEPELGYYLKGFNEIAAVVGAVGAGTFAIGVLYYALRQIPRFDLTDINRF